jgi:hypothetical protein
MSGRYIQRLHMAASSKQLAKPFLLILQLLCPLRAALRNARSTPVAPSDLVQLASHGTPLYLIELVSERNFRALLISD